VSASSTYDGAVAPGADVVRRRRRRRTSSSASPRYVAIIAGVLTLAVAGSALALGAVHTAPVLVVAVLLLAGFALALRSRAIPSALPWPALVLLLLAAYSALQATPLPSWVVERLTPRTAELWSSAHQLLGRQTPRWLTLSLEPVASRLEAIKWASYGIAFALAAGLASARRRGEAGAPWPQDLGVRIAFVSAIAVAVVTLLHRLLGATHVYGFYRPVGEFSRASIGPLMNPNNLAGYLNFGVFCGLGLGLAQRSNGARAVVALGIALLLGAAIESGSRGGLVALVLGMAAFLPLALLMTRARSARPAVALTFSVVLLGSGLALLAIGPDFVSHFSDKSLRKLAMASWVVPMLRDHTWLGIGRGAFEAVFQQYRIGENNLIYSHPENFLVQWASEWGLPVSVVAFGALGWLLRPRALGARGSSAALGLVVALGVLLIQNLVDLGLEVPAVSLTVATALGSAWGAALGNRSLWAAPRIARPIVLVGCAALVTLCLTSTERVGEARRRIEGELDTLNVASAPALLAFQRSLGHAVLEHPADPYFPRIGAIVALRTKDDAALRWINRALELGMTSGRTHYVTALALARTGHREQALLELRYAATYDTELIPSIAEKALIITRDPEALKRAAPVGPGGARLLLVLAREFGAPAEAPARIALLRGAVERDTHSARAHLELARALLSAASAEPLAAPCAPERSTCFVAIREHATLADRLAPDDSAGAEILAKLAVAQGDPAGAERLLRTRCESLANKRECLLLRLQLATAAKDGALATEVALELTRQGCSSTRDCARLYDQIGSIFSAAKTDEVALAYYEKAAKEDPSDTRWLKVADVATHSGRFALALSALQRVERRRGSRDTRLRARIEEARRAVLTQSLTNPSP
jgi:tetratricopeptide (TPR) repeat protein